MTASTATVSPFDLWNEEPSARPDRKKIRARIGGLHCWLCTGTTEKALGRLPGVDKVAVSLTHEQALVEYDPAVARPEQLLQTLRDIGYTISDPRKLRAFEDEERDLVREGRRFVAAVALSVAAIPIIADPSVGWIGFLPALVCLSLGGFVFLVLRSSGLWAAVAGAGGLRAMARRRLGSGPRLRSRKTHPQHGRSGSPARHPQPACALRDRGVRGHGRRRDRAFA